MLRIRAFGHKDHGVTEEDILEALAANPPESNPAVPFVVMVKTGKIYQSGLYGPKSGDAPVSEGEVFYRPRGPRNIPSRMIDKPHRPSDLLTVVGIRDGDDLTIFTAYGGYAAPREPQDSSIQNDPVLLRESQEFWSMHALSSQ